MFFKYFCSVLMSSAIVLKNLKIAVYVFEKINCKLKFFFKNLKFRMLKPVINPDSNLRLKHFDSHLVIKIIVKITNISMNADL